MNAKISVFIVCVEVIIYLVIYNLHDCTFKFWIFRLEQVLNFISN